MLFEYISLAPLVSPQATRGRSALSLLSSKLMMDGVEKTPSESSEDKVDQEEVKSDGRVEELWRDLLVEWVGQLLTENPKQVTETPAQFVASLSAAATRIRRIHETSPLPPAAKLLDRRAFANAYARLSSTQACRVVQRLANRAHALLDNHRSEFDARQRRRLLDQLAALINCLQCAQDIRPFYLNYLARRLVRGRIVSVDSERSFLDRFDTDNVIGSGRRMLQDADLSDESADSYPDMSFELAERFHPIIATRSSWPNSTLPIKPMRIAAPMQRLCSAFDVFFKQWNGHSGKHAKLLWCPTVGTVTLGVSVLGLSPESEAQVVVSTVQACILLLFQQRNSGYMFDDIVRQLELPIEDVYSQFRSLVAPKQQLLIASGGIVNSDAKNAYSLASLWDLQLEQALGLGLKQATFCLNVEYFKQLNGTIVVHEVVDSSTDYLASASAAAELFAWRAQLIEAATMRVLKKRNTLEKEAQYIGYTEVIDIVCADLRERFDVESSDVTKALEKLCTGGVVARRQQLSGGGLTEVCLLPPEDMDSMAPEEVSKVLSNLDDTTSVTGYNLFRLLTIKFGEDANVKAMDLPTFEAGLLRVTLRRNLKFAFDGNVTSEHGAGWCVSVSDMAQELPHAFARAFADELSSLLRQADLNPTTVLPCFETLSQKFQARSLPDITEPSPIVPSNVEPRSLEALSRTVSLLMDGLFGEKAGFVASSLKLQLSELLPHLHALVLNDGQAAEGTEGQFLMTEEVGKALFKKVCKHAMNAIDSVNRAAITSDVPPSPPEVSDGTVPVFTFGGSVPVVSAESIPTTTDEAKEESKTEKSGEVETSKDSSDPLLTDAAVSNLLITFLRKWAPGIWNTELASKMKLKVRYEDHVSCNVTLDGSTTATTTATTPTPITLNEAAKTEQENKPPPSSAILRDPQQGSHTCKNCSGLFNTCFGDYGFRNNEAFSPWQAGVSVNLSHYPESPNSNYCCHACEQNHSAQPATGRFGQPAPTTFGGGGFGEPAP
eukprot:CAMPEP_0114396692 /NCGR_PEP_ID=MMETSP0102-20121206/13752_1 /TAXON_ID=38822 ORGANISM="Pteridomonas danica, Strain PT" /NCGR_SAMPLE_ID=MMETSP0102 /ASSEMBLY_ACC=CAM_ASM_000212 /LENGTH=1004 /DNA_ID=CAMNT_0001557525 /DNA_START=6 /DNA_END=3017 /DNA_ORIENTATION=+